MSPDEAWSREYEGWLAYRARRNRRRRERAATEPGFRERQNAYHRAWYQRHLTEMRAYHRDWKRRKVAASWATPTNSDAPTTPAPARPSTESSQ